MPKFLKVPWTDIPDDEWITTYQLGQYECMSIMTLQSPADSIKYAFGHLANFEMKFINNELIEFSARENDAEVV
jgi:hypothetical protein